MSEVYDHQWMCACLNYNGDHRMRCRVCGEPRLPEDIADELVDILYRKFNAPRNVKNGAPLHRKE